jgi:uncharacterized ion transporter superfamily protein YfcC
MATIIWVTSARLASLGDMPKPDARLLFVVLGAGVGAVVRDLVLQACSGPVMPLVGFGAATVVAGFVIGLALGAPDGLVKAFALGLGTSTASLSLYAFLGVTHRVVASATFLVSVPLLTALALTAGIIAVGARSRVADDAKG